MIEKLKATNIPNQIYSKAPDNFELMDKINEIIDCLNEQEKNNSCRVIWAHQDSITGNNIV